MVPIKYHSGGKMIDWERVRDLYSQIGPNDFAEIVSLFLSEVGGSVDGLTVLASPSDVAARLHFLKGAALNLGFYDFSQLCKQAEFAAKNGQGVNLLAPPLCDSFAQSKAIFLEEWRDRLT